MTAIEACPPLAAGDGAVVTGRYITRGAGKLVRVTLDDGSDLVGTAQHPIWSQSRRAWTPLGELLPGEHLPGRAGPLAVLSVVPLPGVADVYNLEIHGQHVYAITAAGVLVHNATGGGYNVPLRKSTFELPKTWQSAKGVYGVFSDGKHSFRIDTHNLSPGERFHVHIYNPRKVEIAVIQGAGTNGIWRFSHMGEVLSKPSELARWLRTDIRRLLRHALKEIP